MLRILVSIILIILITGISIYQYGLRTDINYIVVISSITVLLGILAGYYFSYKLKEIKPAYTKINTGFIFLIISQSFFTSYFLTNLPELVLYISEIFIKLPGLLLLFAGFISWLKTKEQTIKNQEEEWSSIVDSVNDIVVVLQDNKVKYVNSQIRTLLGYDPEELKDRHFLRFISEREMEQIQSSPEKIIKLPTVDKKERFFKVNSYLSFFRGKPAHICIFKDITDRIEKEKELLSLKERLKEIEEKLSETQKLARIGYWEVNLSTGKFWLSKEAARIFNCPAEKQVYDFEKFLNLVLPQFRNDVRAKRYNAIENLVPYEIEYKIKTPAGTKIIREKVKILTDEKKPPVVLGIVQDITEIHMIYQQVLENEERYRNLFEYSNDAIVISDMDGNILDVNQKALYKMGYSKFDIRMLNIRNIFGSTFQKVFPGWLKKLYTAGYIRFETDVITRSKRSFPAEVSASVFEIKDKKYIQLIIRDISDRKNAEKELKLASIVFDNALEGIIITDKNGKILRTNNALTELTGYHKIDLMGWNIKELHLLRTHTIWNEVVKNGKWQGETTAIKKSGETFPVWLSIIQVKNKNETTNYILMISDITRRKHKEKKLKSLAYYDNLTKLPNRVYLFSKIKHAVERSYEEKNKVALFFIDLDGFKQVNDTYGHKIGDKLLKEVANRLRSSVRKDDFVARLAGDEFVILIEGVNDKEVLKKIAEKIIKNVGKPYLINGKLINIGTSIGISILPDDADDIETFLKHADFAMYHSKLMGKNRYTFYSDIVHKSA